MGPKASTPVDNTENNEELKISHPLFAVAKLIKDKEDQSLIQTQLRLANKNEFDAWVKRVSEVPNNESLMLPNSQYYTEEGFCGTSGIAHITYQNFPYLLSDEISNREGLNKKLFEENELWYLVYTLLSAAFTYHREGKKVGDIRPDNIFINEDGQVQVACIDSWPGEQNNYAKAFYEKQITYLSPEEIKDYQFGKMEESVDLELAETFSIGLTSLDAATLSESKSLYKKNFKFDYEKLEQRIADFRKYGYSELLTLTIENMCEVDTEYRSTSREILEWLLPYEEAIINLENFEVTGIPEKMRLAKERQLQTSVGSSIHTPTQNSQYIGSAFVQPSAYSVQSGQMIQNYTQAPIIIPPYNPSSSTYTPQTYVNPPANIQVKNQPATYSVSAVQPVSTSVSIVNPVPSSVIGTQGLQNFYAVNSTAMNSYGSNVVNEGPKFTLEQINKQLEESRRLFPQ